ncbi:MAG: glucosaminidase domain-containing protein [Treponemataceae bacterium]
MIILKNYFIPLFCITIALISCATTSIDGRDIKTTDDLKKLPPVYIMGEGKKTSDELYEFFIIQNTAGSNTIALELANLYIEEGKTEGVNSDVAFIQMCLETGFLKYGGLVTPEMNNFCGLGAIDENNKGLSFPTARIGVRAHIQHLKAYASVDPLQQPLVDPRYRYVNPKGKSPTIEGLAGTWAADKSYAIKLMRLYTDLQSR